MSQAKPQQNGEQSGDKSGAARESFVLYGGKSVLHLKDGDLAPVGAIHANGSHPATAHLRAIVDGLEPSGGDPKRADWKGPDGEHVGTLTFETRAERDAAVEWHKAHA